MGARIAYVTESFPPAVNGVAHTAVRVAEHLVSRGHEPLVIAPEPAGGPTRADRAFSFPVVRVRSVAIPAYPGFRLGLPGPRARAAVAGHRPDLVHLAGPFVLGAAAGTAARRLRRPAVAVYATDMPAYARAYHAGPGARRSAGGGCAGFTTPPTGPSLRARRPPPRCTPTASSEPGCGPGESTAAGSTRPSAALTPG